VGRPKEHDDATRIALLAAAERLIDTHGPDAASVRAVADAVGTTTRAVYSVFGSKHGLLEALATRLFEVLSDAIDAVPRTDDAASDLVEAGVRAFRQTALDHPSLYRLVFVQVVPDLELGSDFGAVATAAFGRLEQLIARIDETGALGARTVGDAAVAFHSLTEGLATVELRGEMLDAASAERVWRDALASMLRGWAVG
jgi:AcrR family transcriptional regulator